jgi:hypothetical protein
MRSFLRSAILSGYACGIVGVACAQEDGMTFTKLLNGITVTKLQGVYRYKSGGVPLFGYIQKIAKEYQSSDKVSFVVCNTGHVINVKFGDLSQVDQACPTVPISSYPVSPASMWQEWKLSSGKLIAMQKPHDSKTPMINVDGLNISDLPKDYQILLANEPRDKPAAVTFSAPNTGPLLGIVEKSKM